MHLVGYFYETYHDARSPERKVSYVESKSITIPLKCYFNTSSTRLPSFFLEYVPQYSHILLT